MTRCHGIECDSVTAIAAPLVSATIIMLGDDNIDKLEYQVYKAVIKQEYLSHPSGFLDMKERKPILPKTIIIIDQTISALKIFDTPVEKLLNKGEATSFPENEIKSYMIKNKA